MKSGNGHWFEQHWRYLTGRYYRAVTSTSMWGLKTVWPWLEKKKESRKHCFLISSSDQGSSVTVVLLYSGSDTSIILHLMFQCQGLRSLTQKKWAISAFMNFSQWTLTQHSCASAALVIFLCVQDSHPIHSSFHRYGGEGGHFLVVIPFRVLLLDLSPLTYVIVMWNSGDFLGLQIWLRLFHWLVILGWTNHSSFLIHILL